MSGDSAGWLFCSFGFCYRLEKNGLHDKTERAASTGGHFSKGMSSYLNGAGIASSCGVQALRDQGGTPFGKASMIGLPEVIPKHQLRHWLAHKVASGRFTRVEQLLWLRSMFPEVPSDCLDKVVGQDVTVEGPDVDGVPWNRRKRRTIIGRAKPGEVLLRIFSRVQKWKGPGTVLEVDKCLGPDLLQKNVYQHLLVRAVRGVVGGVVGGPPCRTISRCRSDADVRDGGEGRWGLPGLPANLVQLVREDSVLWLRFLFIHAVAQAAADVCVGSGNEQ